MDSNSVYVRVLIRFMVFRTIHVQNIFHRRHQGIQYFFVLHFFVQFFRVKLIRCDETVSMYLLLDCTVVQNGRFWSKWKLKFRNIPDSLSLNLSVQIWFEWLLWDHYTLLNEKLQVFVDFMENQRKFKNWCFKTDSVWPKMPWKWHILAICKKSLGVPCVFDSANDPLRRGLQRSTGSDRG